MVPRRPAPERAATRRTVPAADRFARLLARLDRPAAAGGVAGLLAAVFVLLRAAVAAGGSVGAFVVAGSTYARPGALPDGLPVVTGPGYDGQFYFRQALDPFDVARTAFGITLDNSVRLARIGYPALAWLVSFGQRSFVPWSLIVVNVAGLAALGGLGAVLARTGGRHALWGLLLPAYPGFLWTLSRDLTEIAAAALLVGGLLAIRLARPLVAGLLLAGSALTRETAMVTVGCVAATWMVRRVGGHPKQPPDGPPAGHAELRAVTWVLPTLAFGGLQVALLTGAGRLTLLRSGQKNLGPPLAGLADGIAHYVGHLPAVASLLWVGELAVLVTVVALAGTVVARDGPPVHERMAWAALCLLAVVLASGIWLGDVGFRSLDDLYVVSGVVLLASPRRIELPAAMVATAWLVVAVELVRFI